MGDREELRAGEYKVTWKPVTSSRIDTAALLLILALFADGLKETIGPGGFVLVSVITLTASEALQFLAGIKRKAPCITADQSTTQETH